MKRDDGKDFEDWLCGGGKAFWLDLISDLKCFIIVCIMFFGLFLVVELLF